MHLTWDQNSNDVTVNEEGPDALSLDDDQLRYCLELSCDHPYSPAQLAGQLPWEVRQAIRRQALKGDQDLRIAWARAAAKYAPITMQDGRWHLEFYRIVHRENVDTWAVSQFLVTEDDQRFFTLRPHRDQPVAVMTSAEFQYHFGETPLEHLEVHRNDVHAHLDRVAAQLTSPLVTRELTLQVPGGVTTRRQKSILASTERNWELAPGELLLDTQVVADTVPLEDTHDQSQHPSH